MDIKILETICWGGSKLAPIVDAALDRLNLDDEFDIISDIKEIIPFQVTQLPALVVNGKVKHEGGLPSINEVVEMLESED